MRTKFKNFQLNYLYRDGANYKQFGNTIFRNQTGLTIEEAERLIQEKLISSEFFIPQDWGLHALQHYKYDPEIDHEWHEFENFEATENKATDDRDISDFLNEIQKGYEI